MGLVYTYMTFSEYLTMFYSGKQGEADLLSVLFAGRFALVFWGTMLITLIIPILTVALPGINGVPGLLVASLLINLGMWLKR